MLLQIINYLLLLFYPFTFSHVTDEGCFLVDTLVLVYELRLELVALLQLVLDFGCWVGRGWVGSLLQWGRGRKTQGFVGDWHAVLFIIYICKEGYYIMQCYAVQSYYYQLRECNSLLFGVFMLVYNLNLRNRLNQLFYCIVLNN